MGQKLLIQESSPAATLQKDFPSRSIFLFEASLRSLSMIAWGEALYATRVPAAGPPAAPLPSRNMSQPPDRPPIHAGVGNSQTTPVPKDSRISRNRSDPGSPPNPFASTNALVLSSSWGPENWKNAKMASKKCSCEQIYSRPAPIPPAPPPHAQDRVGRSPLRDARDRVGRCPLRDE